MRSLCSPIGGCLIKLYFNSEYMILFIYIALLASFKTVLRRNWIMVDVVFSDSNKPFSLVLTLFQCFLSTSLVVVDLLQEVQEKQSLRTNNTKSICLWMIFLRITQFWLEITQKNLKRSIFSFKFLKNPDKNYFFTFLSQNLFQFWLKNCWRRIERKWFF